MTEDGLCARRTVARRTKHQSSRDMAQVFVPTIAALAGAFAGRHIGEKGAKDGKEREVASFNADAYQNHDHELDAKSSVHLAQEWPEVRSLGSGFIISQVSKNSHLFRYTLPLPLP